MRAVLEHKPRCSMTHMGKYYWMTQRSKDEVKRLKKKKKTQRTVLDQRDGGYFKVPAWPNFFDVWFKRLVKTFAARPVIFFSRLHHS